jgi:hypothetical protein
LVVQWLCEGLKDADVGVRVHACKACTIHVSRGTQQVVSLILDCLTCGDSAVRHAAANTVPSVAWADDPEVAGVLKVLTSTASEGGDDGQELGLRCCRMLLDCGVYRSIEWEKKRREEIMDDVVRIISTQAPPARPRAKRAALKTMLLAVAWPFNVLSRLRRFVNLTMRCFKDGDAGTRTCGLNACKAVICAAVSARERRGAGDESGDDVFGDESEQEGEEEEEEEFDLFFSEETPRGGVSNHGGGAGAGKGGVESCRLSDMLEDASFGERGLDDVIDNGSMSSIGSVKRESRAIVGEFYLKDPRIWSGSAGEGLEGARRRACHGFVCLLTDADRRVRAAALQALTTLANKSDNDVSSDHPGSGLTTQHH